MTEVSKQGTAEGGVGAVGGLFDKDFQDDISNIIKYDATGEWWANRAQESLDASLLNNSKVGQTIENVAQGVGGMLPSIAVSAIPGVGPALGMATMMTGAAGQTMQESLQNENDYNMSLLYGLTSGAIEGITEKIGGFTLGGGKSIVGKALAGTALGKATQKGVGRAAYTFVSEGAEEVLSDLLDPINKGIFAIDSDGNENMLERIGTNYKNDITGEGLLDTFVVGGTVGSIMQGGQDVIRGAKNKGRGGFKANTADNFLEYKRESAELYNGNAENDAKVDRAIIGSYEGMSEELKKMTPEKRAKYLESIGTERLAFNDDGDVVVETLNTANKNALSKNLRVISGNIENIVNENGYNIVKDTATVTEQAKAAKENLERILEDKSNVVIVDGENLGFDAAYDVDNKLLYINNSSELSDEKLSQVTILHELAHTTEGTTAYNKLAGEVGEYLRSLSVGTEEYTKWHDKIKQIENSYRNNEYREEIQNYVNETELYSDVIGDMLGNEYFINRLARRNKGLATKIFGAIKDLITKSKTKNGITKEAMRMYKKFENALNHSKGGVKISELDEQYELLDALKEKSNDKKSSKDGDTHIVLCPMPLKLLTTAMRKGLICFCIIMLKPPLLCSSRDTTKYRRK